MPEATYTQSFTFDGKTYTAQHTLGVMAFKKIRASTSKPGVLGVVSDKITKSITLNSGHGLPAPSADSRCLLINRDTNEKMIVRPTSLTGDELFVNGVDQPENTGIEYTETSYDMLKYGFRSASSFFDIGSNIIITDYTDYVGYKEIFPYDIGSAISGNFSISDKFPNIIIAETNVDALLRFTIADDTTTDLNPERYNYFFLSANKPLILSSVPDHKINISKSENNHFNMSLLYHYFNDGQGNQVIDAMLFLPASQIANAFCEITFGDNSVS